MLKRPRAQVQDFTIGWICALEVEVNAARAILDEEYEDDQQAGSYILGRIGGHNVVIACPPAGWIGIGAAAVTAERLRVAFPTVQYGLLVGIGGGVPSSATDIRLGDVVISQPQGASGGLVQYDFGKIGPNGQIRTGSLNAPPQTLLTAVTKFRSNLKFNRGQLHLSLAVHAKGELFRRPPVAYDVLYDATYQHVSGPTCDSCSDKKTIARSRRLNENIQVFCGLIGSGNQVIKDGLTRDSLAKELGGVLCFEMEAAGLMNSFPCLVIRGVCDYCDSHKNKQWQPFAAVAAAACAREVLSCITPASSAGYTNMDRVQSFASMSSQTLVPSEPDWSQSSIPETLFESLSSNHEKVTLTGTALSEDERQIRFESLRFDQIEARHFSVKKAHSKTCRWLLKRAELENWLDPSRLEEHYGFLWIKGKAATGKSTIMKFLLSHVKNTRKSALVIAFFFNARGATIEKSTMGMYQSLLYQLLEQRPDLKSVFDACLTAANHLGSLTWDVETLQTLLRLTVERLSDQPLICFIDALDECDDDEVHEMVKFLNELSLDVVPTGIQFRVLFSSRHYPHITIDKGISLILEDQTEHAQDITEYIKSELDIGKSQKVQKIRDEISERASGIFLWVVLVVEILKKEYRRGHIHALERRLRDVPNDIHRLFDDILSRGASCSQETTLCLQWVLYAKRPLKLEELYFAIISGFEPDAIAVWDEQEITRGDMERFILDASRGLVEQTRSKSRTMQFIHESVREFFLNGNGLRNPVLTSAEMDPLQSHSRLMLCCMAYLENANIFEHLRPLPGDSLPAANSPMASELREKASNSFPFLEYAVHNVLYHIDIMDAYGSSQVDFANTFDFESWVLLSNVLQRYQVRRYQDGVPLLYIFADHDLPRLMRIEITRDLEMGITNESHRLLFLAGLAAGNADHLRAIVTDQSQQDHVIKSLPANVNPTDVEIRQAMKILRENQRSFHKKVNDSLVAWAWTNKQTTLLKIVLATRRFSAGGMTYEYRRLVDDIVQERDITALDYFLRRDFLTEEAKHKNIRYWLAKAIEFGWIAAVRALLSWDDAEVNTETIGRGLPIDTAAPRRHSDVMNLFFEQSFVDVDADRATWGPPLQEAASRGHVDVVKLLLELDGIDVNARNRLEGTPLTASAKNGHVEVVDLLLERKEIDANSDNFWHNSPLLAATKNGHAAIVKTLLERTNVDVNLRCPQGNSSLYSAAANGNTEIVRLLLRQKDIDLDLKNAEGHTPFSAAGVFGQTEITELFLKHDFGPDKRSKNARLAIILFNATRNGHLPIVELFLKQKSSAINWKNQSGKTILSVAIEGGQTHIVRRLLRQDDIDVNAIDRQSRAPLFLAVEEGYVEMIKLLLQQDAIDVNLANVDLQTPLHKACSRDRIEVVELLLQHKDISVNAVDASNRTPLWWTVRFGYSEISRLLKKNGAHYLNDAEPAPESMSQVEWDVDDS